MENREPLLFAPRGDEAGTLALLGGVWGFDPADPPQWVPIVAELTVSAE